MAGKLRAKAETALEVTLFASRWLLAPFFVGLALGLIILLVKFVEELVHLGLGAWKASAIDVTVGMLGLVELALTGSLLVIVILAGYENFVSRFHLSQHRDWPAWLGTVDFAALKMKLLSTIVAISAIQLLREFMSLKAVSDRELMWYTGIHITFVVSALLLALSDRVAGGGGGGAHGSRPEPGEPKATEPPLARPAASAIHSARITSTAKH